MGMGFDTFGRSVTDRVSNQRHITMPPQITCAAALPGKTEKHENRISLKCCISALPESNKLFDIFNLFDSRLTMLYDSLNHVINAFSPQGCWGHWFRRKEVESAARAVHQCAVFWVSYFAR